MVTRRVVVVGSVNLDVSYGVPHLPRPGETVLGTRLERRSGGKGGNQAHAAARVAPDGVAVAMVACVGDDDAGPILRGDLEAAGVDVAAVLTVAGASGIALLAVDPTGENTIVVVPGANAAWPDAALAATSWEEGDVVVLQLEVPFRVVESVAAAARQAGARVVLNAAPFDGRIVGLVPQLAVLVVNEIEAAELLGIDDPDRLTPAGFVHTLPCDLVVTLGARGALVVPAGGAARLVDAYPVDAVDTVGAGDAFVGGLSAALAGGASLEAAARWGSAAGALTATVPGARHEGLDRAAVEALAGAG